MFLPPLSPRSPSPFVAARSTGLCGDDTTRLTGIQDWDLATPTVSGTTNSADQSPVRAELDRVGASFHKAGAADFIMVSEDDEVVRLAGPPGEHPRRYWKGPRWQLLSLLAALPDDAGVQAVWRALVAL